MPRNFTPRWNATCYLSTPVEFGCIFIHPGHINVFENNTNFSPVTFGGSTGSLRQGCHSVCRFWVIGKNFVGKKWRNFGKVTKFFSDEYFCRQKSLARVGNGVKTRIIVLGIKFEQKLKNIFVGKKWRNLAKVTNFFADEVFSNKVLSRL